MPDNPAPTISTSTCCDGMVVSMAPLSCPAGSDAVLRAAMPGHDAAHCFNQLGNSISVMIRLERAFRLHPDIVGLIRPQRCQFGADLGEMQPRHLLVQRLRQHVDLRFVFAAL